MTHHPITDRCGFTAHLTSSALLLLTAAAVQAQTAPALDAGSLQREAERSLQTPPGATPAPQAAPAAKPMPADAKATRVTVRHIAIEGASLIAVEELDALVAKLKSLWAEA